MAGPAGFFTDFANNKVLDCLHGGVAITPPATWYFGISLAIANKGGTVTEPSGGSYARVALTNNLTNFPAAVAGAKSNAVRITWPAPTGNWAPAATPALSYFVSDAASGGNVYEIVDFTAPKAILSGGPAPFIEIGAFNAAFT